MSREEIVATLGAHLAVAAGAWQAWCGTGGSKCGFPPSPKPRRCRIGGGTRRPGYGLLLAFALVGAGCTPPPTPTPLPTATPAPTSTPTPSPTPTATPSSTASPTPDPYAGLTIEDLSARSFGGGSLQPEGAATATGAFTRTLVSYPSDGLTIHGFVNEPAGPGPFPVVLLLHGYVNPATYITLAYTTRYADALARAGFLVIHPNYRNHRPSDNGDDRFRIGYAVDVLNLAEIVRQTAGQPGPLARADGERIALFGHSMGGGIAIRAITVDPELDAAVLYGSMSADERQNYERIRDVFSAGQRGQEELAVPEPDLARIAPAGYLDRVRAEVAIHHGTADADVPVAWSRELCTRLQTLGQAPECHEYPGAGHTFTGASDTLFLERVQSFLDTAFGRGAAPVPEPTPPTPAVLVAPTRSP